MTKHALQLFCLVGGRRECASIPKREALRAGESNKGPAKNPSKIQKNLPQTLTLPTARAHTSCKAGSTLCLRSLRRGGDLSHTCTVRKL